MPPEMPHLNPYGVYTTEREAVAAANETTLDLTAYPLHLFCLHDLDGSILGYETAHRHSRWDTELDDALRTGRVRFVARKDWPHHRWRRDVFDARTTFRDSGNTASG